MTERRTRTRISAGTTRFDLYTIVAMQVESEYQESLRLGNQYGGDVHVQTAREIIQNDFAAPTSIGMIRLREHPLFRPEFPFPTSWLSSVRPFAAPDLRPPRNSEKMETRSSERQLLYSRSHSCV